MNRDPLPLATAAVPAFPCAGNYPRVSLPTASAALGTAHERRHPAVSARSPRVSRLLPAPTGRSPATQTP